MEKSPGEAGMKRTARGRSARLRLELLEGRWLPSVNIGEIVIPHRGGTPSAIVVSADGTAWVADSDPNTTSIERITPDGRITEFLVGATGSAPFTINGMTVGPDGNVWFTETNLGASKIGMITPTGVVTEFSTGLSPFALPWGITAGPDGALWFAEQGDSRIGRITTDGTITEFQLTGNGDPTGIALGSDGNLWFTEFAASKIGVITPSGVIQEISLPNLFSHPGAITPGRDGNLWFTEQGTNQIGRITTAGVISEFTIPNMPPGGLIPIAAVPHDIVSGPDGGLWFTEGNIARGDWLGHITLTGVITERQVPTRTANTFDIAAGPDGRLWFSERNTNQVGVVNQSLTVVTGADAGGGPDVRLIDAVTGKLTGEILAYDPHFTGGVRVAVGDVTGDGVPDFVTAPGAGGGPDIRVFDGTTGQLVREFMAYDPAFSGGVWVAVGDVNGDGFADIITGADAGGGPHVKVFSGKDGSLLASFMAYPVAFSGGVRVAAGDVNGDGFADIITAAGPGGGPHVKVYSGKDGSVLKSFMAYPFYYTGGVFVAAGDLDGTGRADIITSPGSRAFAFPPPPPGSFTPAAPILLNVRVYDALAGTVREVPTYSYLGTGGIRVAVVDDVDGNGLADLVVAIGAGPAQAVNVLDGLTGALVDSFFAYDPQWVGGVFVGAG
jgi:streptogramin lyase